MRTKQWIFRCAAALTAGIAALTGCTVDNTVQKPDDNKAYDNVRFVVNMAEKPSVGDDGDTRALKAGWTEGDAIIVFLDGTVNNWAHLVYSDGDWIISGDAKKITSLEASGSSVNAMHAGSFDVVSDGSHNFGVLESIRGDLLYTDGGSYTASYNETTGGWLVTLNITLARGFTTAIKVQTIETTEEQYGKWRLAGEGLWVQNSETIGAADLVGGVDFDTLLKGLFTESSSTDRVAASYDPTFSGAGITVFHVWDNSGAGGTSFEMYKTGNDEIVYTRQYPDDLPAGASVLIGGPISYYESDEWEATLPDNMTLYCENSYWDYGSTRYGPDTRYFYPRFTSFDTSKDQSEWNGWRFGFSLVSPPCEDGRNVEFLSLPAGEYRLVDSSVSDTDMYNNPFYGEVSAHRSIGGTMVGQARITEGTLIVEGNTTEGYRMTFSVTLENGETLTGSYEGNMPVYNPNYIPPPGEGEITITLDTPDPYSEGVVLYLYGDGTTKIDWGGEYTEPELFWLNYYITDNEYSPRWDNTISDIAQTVYYEEPGPKTITIKGNITGLRVQSRYVTSIDLSGVPQLQYLSLSDMYMPELNISGNHMLRRLDCEGIGLTSLELPLNAEELFSLNCGRNGLSELNVSGAPHLRYLDCEGNHINRLELYNNHELTRLNCSWNSLSPELDLTACSMLQVFQCQDNMIHNLRLSFFGNGMMEHLDCRHNPLMTELLIEILNEFANQNPPVNPQSGMELGMFLNRPWFDPEDDRELEAQYEQAKAAAEARGWMITEENP